MNNIDAKSLTEKQAIWWRLAYHEAAHAVAAFLCNIGIDSVGYRKEGNWHKAHVRRMPPIITSVESAGKHLACLMAGRIGESLCNKEVLARVLTESIEADEENIGVFVSGHFNSEYARLFKLYYADEKAFKREIELQVSASLSTPKAVFVIHRTALYLYNNLFKKGRIEGDIIEAEIRKYFREWEENKKG